jgi:histone H3
MARNKKTTKKNTCSKALRKHIAQWLAKNAAFIDAFDLKKPQKFKPCNFPLREIRRFQKSTEQLTRKVPFEILKCEIDFKFNNHTKFQSSTILAIHEAARAYLFSLFNVTNPCATHSKKVSIIPKGMQLA